MTGVNTLKPWEEMTMDEVDAIIGPATEKAAADGLAEGVPVVFWS